MNFKFIRLEVSGYRRLALSDTKDYIITPKDIHLILGTNGSGKSSLMNLLTPYPPDRKDFLEDGYKLIIFEYNDSVYRIHSSNGHHSLYKDNEAISEGVGVKTMEQLVYEYFKIDANIHRFILGKDSVVSMGLNQRKDFISKISHVDFDYANRLYQNIKKKLRDNQAILKHTSGKLLELKEYILSSEEIDKLLKTKEDLTKEIYKLYELKKDDVQLVSTTLTLSDLETIKNNITSLSMDISRLRLTDINDINNIITVTDYDRTKHLKELNIIEQQLMELSRELTKEEVSIRVNDIDKKLEALKAGRTVFDLDGLKIKDIDKLVNILTTCHELAIEVSGIDLETLVKQINTNRTKIQKLTDEKFNLEVELGISETELSAYRFSADKMKCPSCGVLISNEVLSTAMTNLVNKIKSINKNIIDLDTSINTFRNSNQHLEDTFVSFSKIKLSLSDTGLSKYIDLESITPNKVSRIKWEISTLENYTSLIKERKDLLSREIQTDAKSKYGQLEKRYSELTEDIKELTSSLDFYKTFQNRVNKITTDVVEVKKFLDTKHSNRKKEINSITNKSIDMIILELKDTLNKVTEQIDKFQYMSNEEKSLNSEIKQVETDIRLLTLLLKELSPSTGLIAESIKSFLHNYIEEVNSIIASVWSYELKVLPFDSKEDKGITYRFPVITKGEDNAKDISETSESMREIISLAFRLVSLKYMGMSHYPLMIDEFGRSMDEVHLIKSYDLLEDISVENDIQMFIIAHIKACYNRFQNAGMSIISDLNLEKME